MTIYYFAKLRRYNPLEMIEMDRFVSKLRGKEVEDIKRSSLLSASTMKAHGMTMNRLTHYHDSGNNIYVYHRMAGVMKDFLEHNKNRDGRLPTETFCGLPHHLYLPRL